VPRIKSMVKSDIVFVSMMDPLIMQAMSWNSTAVTKASVAFRCCDERAPLICFVEFHYSRRSIPPCGDGEPVMKPMVCPLKGTVPSTHVCQPEGPLMHPPIVARLSDALTVTRFIVD